MEFKVPGMQQNQVYNITPSSASASSNYTNFSDQAMEGGGQVDIQREVIQRELEMEMIREKIIAEEVERFQVLEEQVRRELMLGRQMMAMNITKGFPSSSSSILGPPPGEIKETTTSLPKVGMGNLYDPILRLKPPPPQPSLVAAVASSELNSCDSKKKMELRCSICKISASCERGLIEHLAGKKHNVKAASLVITNTPILYERNTMEWRCPICEVSAPCERGLQDHLAGKKHQTKVANMKSAETLEPSLLLVTNDSSEDKKKREWRCPICEVCSRSEIDFQMHLAGKKHIKAKVKLAIIRRKGIINF